MGDKFKRYGIQVYCRETCPQCGVEMIPVRPHIPTVERFCPYCALEQVEAHCDESDTEAYNRGWDDALNDVEYDDEGQRKDTSLPERAEDPDVEDLKGRIHDLKEQRRKLSLEKRDLLDQNRMLAARMREVREAKEALEKMSAEEQKELQEEIDRASEMIERREEDIQHWYNQATLWKMRAGDGKEENHE